MAKPDRAIVVPRFGRLLAHARGRLMPSEVVARIHAMSPSMHGFTRPQLDRYEAGKTPRPDPVALFYLAKLYGANVEVWMTELAREREEVKVARRDGTAGGVRGDPSSERRPVRARRAGSA